MAALGKEVTQRAESCAQARKLHASLRRQVEVARRGRARNLDTIDSACRRLIAEAAGEARVSDPCGMDRVPGSCLLHFRSGTDRGAGCLGLASSPYCLFALSRSLSFSPHLVDGPWGLAVAGIGQSSIAPTVLGLLHVLAASQSTCDVGLIARRRAFYFRAGTRFLVAAIGVGVEAQRTIQRVTSTTKTEQRGFHTCNNFLCQGGIWGVYSDRWIFLDRQLETDTSPDTRSRSLRLQVLRDSRRVAQEAQRYHTTLGHLQVWRPASVESE